MQPVPAGYPIEEQSGPYIVGCLLNWGLFGTLSVQLYLYYLAFPDDRRFTKYLVYGVYVIEFVQTMLIAHDAFAMYGYGFGDIDALARMDYEWLSVPIMSAIVACVGQVFYAYRIFIVSKSQIIPILVICVSLTSSVAAVILGIGTFQDGNNTEMANREMAHRKNQIAAGIWCGASALCDILIAICMTYYLMRSTTNFRRTRMLVTKIIRLTIETGSVTAVVALLTLILFFAFPQQGFYVTPALLVPKLYANAIYVVLNSRFQIIGGRYTYMSSTDISFTTTMIRDILSQSAEDTRPADGRQEREPVIVISHEVSNDNHEMGQISDKPPHGCMSLPV
ncbi:hypothetical protein ARMSODRAFT_1006054 [Armillaria solidipes]|uniref:DUF6534 domain-containing protein n=1 Tax=Armillaria solidipes TaxID=1076256 RepID=A0A2H3BT93_9AGAR|nr:hypothetical protein ARMSODRAFT_1006054 [Armillaria solidipes]